MGIFKGKKKKDDDVGQMGSDGHQYVTAEQLKEILDSNRKATADLAARAVDQSLRDAMSKAGGARVVGGVSKQEARDLRELIFNPDDNRMMEMTRFNEKECALHPWLRMLNCSLSPRRQHGSLLGSFLLYKEKCNRSLDGNLLDQTVTMAGIDSQKEAFNDQHISGA